MSVRRTCMARSLRAASSACTRTSARNERQLRPAQRRAVCMPMYTHIHFFRIGTAARPCLPDKRDRRMLDAFDRSSCFAPGDGKTRSAHVDWGMGFVRSETACVALGAFTAARHGLGASFARFGSPFARIPRRIAASLQSAPCPSVHRYRVSAIKLRSARVGARGGLYD